MRADPAFKDRPFDWSNYVRYLHGQVRELMTNYGKIDLLVVDFSYNDFVGAKWGAAELIAMIRRLQPDCVINDRLGNAESGSIKDAAPPPWVGDFDTCELNTPHRPTTNAAGQILPWDLWATHNNSWCYSANDHAWKDAASVVRTLVNCVSKSGNLSFNFGPDARGQLPPESVALQQAVAGWMSANGASVHGCGLAPFERPDWGRWTMSNDGRTLYAHVLEQPMGHLTLPGLRGKVANPRLLATGAEAFLADFWNPGVQSFGRPDDVFLNLHKPAMLTYPMPDATDTVIAMDIVG
jgi:alpha-L-fucosidase